MKSHLLVTAATALTVGVLAFAVGRRTAPKEDETRIAPLGAKIGSDRSQRSLGTGLTGSRLRPATERPERGRSNKEALRRVVAIADPLERAQAWLDFVNQLEPHEFEAVVAEFRDSGLAQENLGEYAMLLTAWANVDPLAALDYSSSNTRSSFARNTILTAWVARDPEAAINWAKSNHDGKGPNPYMIGVIRGLAPHDLERATTLLAEMPYSEERGEALSSILSQILTSGIDGAREWTLTIEDERLREGAISRLGRSLANDDPEAAARWLIESPAAAERSLDNVVAAWAEQDFSAASGFFQSLSNPEQRSTALRGLTNLLASSDPVAAASLLANHTADANDEVYEQFVWHSARNNPELAANHIGMIQDAGERNSLYRRLIGRWLDKDRTAATRWIQDNPSAEVQKILTPPPSHQRGE